MKNLFSRILFFFGALFLCSNTSFSGVPNNDHPTTFLGPTLKAGFTSTINDVTAYSFLGEAGIKNFRLGATVGWQIVDNQRLKLSAEYLWQDITYPFFSGDTDQWVQQAAIGAYYEYNWMDCLYNPVISVGGFLSHAPSKSLSSVRGIFTRNGVTANFVDNRRIAGSNAGGLSPGVSITPWLGGRVGVELNYDNVNYDKNYTPNEDAKGFGGTVRFNQALMENVDFGVQAAVRQPFNNYEAYIDWNNLPYYGRWTVGLDAGYTAGKNTLPSTYNVGINANLFLDERCGESPVRNLKGEAPVQAVPDDLLAWTANPAVYLPQVLAIPDDQVIIPDPADPICTPVPAFTARFADVSGTSPYDASVDASTHFSGAGLHYSISVAPALVAPDSITINANTGVITIQSRNAPTNYTVTVTAANLCGSASGSFHVIGSAIG